MTKNILFILLIIAVINGFSQKLNQPNGKVNGNWTIELRNNDLGIVKTILSFTTDSNTYWKFRDSSPRFLKKTAPSIFALWSLQ